MSKEETIKLSQDERDLIKEAVARQLTHLETESRIAVLSANDMDKIKACQADFASFHAILMRFYDLDG